jgi:hypothetical protein
MIIYKLLRDCIVLHHSLIDEKSCLDDDSEIKNSLYKTSVMFVSPPDSVPERDTSCMGEILHA